MTKFTQPRAFVRILFILALLVSSCFAQSPVDPYSRRLEDLLSRFEGSTAPAKAVILDRIAGLRDYVNDPGTVLKAFDRILSGRSENTLVRDEAKWQRAQIAMHERRLSDVSFAIETLGFLRDWNLSASRDCKGKNLAAGIALHISPLGTVNVYDSPASVCAVTAVYTSSAQDVALRFSASTPLSIYVNGTLLKSAPSSALAFDQ